VSKDHKAILFPVTMAGAVADAEKNIDKVLAITEPANGKDGFQVHTAGFSSVGHDFNKQSEKDLQRSEYGPLPLALIIPILAAGAISGVPPAVAAAITILPAILSLLGDRVNAGHIPFIQHAQTVHDEQRPGGFWDTIATFVMRHAGASVIVTASLLVLAAIPYF